ncbi:MAG TPA: hypothetical protein ENK46_05395 [Flavobacteriia bacterium]|nr:hypothetical protein [Flavobacteriia bacterium]
MKRNIVLLMIVLQLVSCKQIVKSIVKESFERSENESISDSNFKTLTVDSLYTISIPKYMKVMHTLNKEASLQYANIYKEIYTIVIDENKQEFVDYFKELEAYDSELSLIDNYTTIQKNFITEGMDNVYKIEPYGLIEINGYNARQFKLMGTVENQKIGYIIAFIEGKEKVFMIMNWTLLGKLSRYENTFEVINTSFEPIQ